MDNGYFFEDIINVNNIDIAYQLHGNPLHPTLLLIHGLSTPLTGWPSEMIKRFVAARFQVLLLDNRDVGRSQQLNHLPIPDLTAVAAELKQGILSSVPYQLEDMMQDVIALLDALNLTKVHVIGASMGGMIAQLIAIHYPQRVNTLTSIMSTTGYKQLPPVEKHINEILAGKPASKEYQDKVQHHINIWQAIGSPRYPSSDEDLYEYVDSMLQRGITAKGTLRQTLAIMAATNRHEALTKLVISSLVIHGDKDGLVNVAGGKATAMAIPNATLKIFPGMGHDFPIDLISDIVQEIVNHTQANNEV